MKRKQTEPRGPRAVDGVRVGWKEGHPFAPLTASRGLSPTPVSPGRSEARRDSRGWRRNPRSS